MDPEKLREDVFFLIGFILTSMQGLYNEPAEYGIYRLLDVGGRLLSIIETHGLSDDFLHNLSQEIEEEKAGSMDSDRQKATISRLALEYSAELQRRLSIENQ
jgi:hypothetical protein